MTKIVYRVILGVRSSMVSTRVNQTTPKSTNRIMTEVSIIIIAKLLKIHIKTKKSETRRRAMSPIMETTPKDAMKLR